MKRVWVRKPCGTHVNRVQGSTLGPWADRPSRPPGTRSRSCSRRRPSRRSASPRGSCGCGGAGAPTTPRGGARALFALGLACGVLPLVSPLDELGDRYLLSAHMLQHMLIGDAAPGAAPRRAARAAALLRDPSAAPTGSRPHAWVRATRRLARPADDRPRRLGPRLRRLAHPGAYDFAARNRDGARRRACELRRSPVSSCGACWSIRPVSGRLSRGPPARRRGRAVRDGDGDRGHPDLQPASALPALRARGAPRLLPLAAPRPAARWDRDDGRAARHARHLCRDPAPARAPPPPSCQAAAREAAAGMTGAYRFGFEPLFLVLALVAAAALHSRGAPRLGARAAGPRTDRDVRPRASRSSRSRSTRPSRRSPLTTCC